MERFGWCFIGSGGITQQVLADFPLMEGAYLASVYSPTFAKAKRLADQHEARAYETLEAAVDDPDVKAVYIATTNNAHKAHTLAALKRGKPVLCEKPFALSRAESVEMITLARQQGCYLMEAMWTRFNPVIDQAIRWVQEGRIGRVRAMEADFAVQAGGGISPRIAKNAYGGGSLLDLGVYPLSLAQFIFDAMPDQIRAVGTLTPERVDSQCAITLRYPGGAIARLYSSVEAAAGDDAVIYGEQGTIALPDFVWGKRAELTTPSGNEVFEIEKPTDGYHYEFNAVMEDIRAGRMENGWVSHAHTLRVMEIMDAIRDEIGLQFDSAL